MNPAKLMAYLKALPDRPFFRNRTVHIVFWVLLAAPYFKPSILGVLEGTETAETLVNCWRLLSAAVACLLYAWRLLVRRKRPSPVLLLLCGYLFFVSVSTVLNGRNYWFLMNYVVTLVSFFLLVELSLADGPEMVLDMLFYPLTVVMLSNLVLLCIYPAGICRGGTFSYVYHLMGIDNFLAPFLVPYMVITVLRSELLWGRCTLLSWFLVGCAAMNLLLTWSTTGIMGLGVMLLFLLFFYKTRAEVLFNGLTSMLAGFGLFWGIVIFRLQNLFAFFIEGVLHKGLSFTGRTDIWDAAEEAILKQPWLGWGLAQYGKVYRLRKGKYYHAHNALLEVPMEGGICALVCFLLALAVSVGPLLVHRRHPYACLMAAGLMACAVMTSMESYLDSNGIMIYALVLLGWHIAEFIEAGDRTLSRVNA